jgi:uncharacterized membrane protein YukC
MHQDQSFELAIALAEKQAVIWRQLNSAISIGFGIVDQQLVALAQNQQIDELRSQLVIQTETAKQLLAKLENTLDPAS